MPDLKTRADALYYYLSGGQADGDPQEVHDVTGVDTGDDWLEIAGDHVDKIAVGDTFEWVGSTGNDGTYTAAAVSLEGGNTRVTTEEDISDGTADGQIELEDEPARSLGAYRTPTEIDALGVTISSPIANVTVDYVAGENGPGEGTLEATGDDDLRWTPPDGQAGASVTILDGQSKILEGGDRSKYIRVTRTSDANLTGSATLTLADVMNNLIGFENVDSEDASSGITEYRAYFVKNEHESLAVHDVKLFIGTLGDQQVSDDGQLGSSGAGTIQTSGSFADWPDRGFVHIKDSGGSTRELIYYSSRTDSGLTVPAEGRGLLGTSASAGAVDDTLDPVPGIRIGIEEPTDDSIQSIADQQTAPSGISWSRANTLADALEIGTLEPGEQHGVWIQYVTPEGMEADPSVLSLIEKRFEAA